LQKWRSGVVPHEAASLPESNWESGHGNIVGMAHASPNNLIIASSRNAGGNTKHCVRYIQHVKLQFSATRCGITAN